MFIQARKVMALVVLFVVLAFMPVSATIINVPADYDTIQVAINASVDGDTVLVAEGHYFERINFYGKGILLTSEFMLDGDTIHIQNTIIDADTSVLGIADTGSVVCFVNGEDSTSVIQGFTIQKGIGIIDGNGRTGGGIYCWHHSSPTIINNKINGNCAKYGGGISCWYSSPTININTINENSVNEAYSSGGGIFCNYYSSPAICNNTITGNSAYYTGGGICCENSSPTINNNMIDGNTAIGEISFGGGISCNEFFSSISNNTISNNSANNGGGIYCCISSSVINNNTIIGNFAYRHGGGIFCIYNPSPTINNNTITGNSAIRGGGIYSYYYSDAIVINTILWPNSADSTGNEIYLDPTSSVTITYSDIQDGWEGEGNIDADPYFCLSDTAYYWLAENSPCVGTGCDSLGNPDSTVNIGAFGIGCDATDILENGFALPMNFSLSQNYPNPFNPTTTISFAIEHPQLITLKVYDLLGRKVCTLIDEDKQAGLHTATFDASDLSSGIYFYRLQAGNMAESKRMVLLK